MLYLDVSVDIVFDSVHEAVSESIPVQTWTHGLDVNGPFCGLHF